MSGMSVAESAVFFHLKTIRIVALVFSRRIVSLLAVRACQRDDDPHDVHLPNNLLNTLLW
jgi:hypothetical protein